MASEKSRDYRLRAYMVLGFSALLGISEVFALFRDVGYFVVGLIPTFGFLYLGIKFLQWSKMI